jgi:asparagine synthase (glutamine-hydrolysing)
MTDAIRHRGPDACGFWQSGDGAMNLGHRRLSILDLSPTGAQPMLTPDGRYALIFNGEIYNYAEIRCDLEAAGERLRGTSDTEVLLYAIRRWGLQMTLPRLNGMFAFAVWDGNERKLWLARDRFGEKPLYYAWHQGVFLFGSELKALLQHPSFKREIAPEGVTSLINFGYIGSHRSIFRGVHKLEAGHFLMVQTGTEPKSPEAYWRPRDMLVGCNTRSSRDPNAVIDELDVIARKAVRQRMVADVPLGAFLSGGIDSSVIVALMQAQSVRPIKTFTIGFREGAYNEAEDAARVAKHLQTEHHEYYLGSRECIDTIMRLPEIYDEPFADSSQIPTTLVSEFTKRHVSVALSGDGGDEFFGGYERYFWTSSLWKRFENIPPGMRLVGRKLINSLSAETWEGIIGLVNHLIPKRHRVRGGGGKMQKIARFLSTDSLKAIYLEMVSNRQWAIEVLTRPDWKGAEFAQCDYPSLPLSDFERMMLLDQVNYMTDDILCKVDRASMSAGLEARVPFLDVALTRYAWSLPSELKVRGGVGKWPLRQLLKRYVPEELFDRPKKGFAVPIDDWLRGPMRGWAEELLGVMNLADCEWFRAKAVRATWVEHLSGRRNLSPQLWPVLMFLAWKRKWL